MSVRACKSFLVVLAFACSPLFAAPIPLVLAPLIVDVTGVPSVGLRAAAGNTVLTFNIGADTTVSSFSWNITLNADSPSFLSEMKLQFTDSAISEGLIFTAAGADARSGTGSYAGTVDLAAQHLDFDVLGDGILRLEFYESFKDAPAGVADGHWTAGTVTFGLTHVVPEPASLALFGIALLLLAKRVRRNVPMRAHARNERHGWGRIRRY